MISKDRLKLGIASGALVVAVVLLAVALAWLGGLHRAFLTGASPRDVFTPVPPVVGDLDPVTVWRPDPDLPREVDPATRTALTDAWTSAFGRVDAALATGSLDDLVTSFSGNALDQVTATVGSAEGLARQVPVAHDLEVVFFSADGSVIELRDHALELVRVASHDGTVEVTHDRERWDAVLLLRDGRWRVEQLVRRSTEPVGASAASTPADPVPGDVPALGVNVLVGDRWTDPWSSFDGDVAAAQLDDVVALGLGHVRVFLPYEDLGAGDPDADVVARVATFLDLAEDRGLRVTLTLFDGWTDRGPEHWPDAVRHLEGVVPVLAEHPALATWDLKNEADRDDEAEGRDLNRAWLRHVGTTVRRLDPSTPRTIGWASAEAAGDLLDVVEVVSLHHYDTPGTLDAVLPAVLAAAGERPVVVQETGLPTWASVLPGGHTEAEQAAYVADVRRVAAANGVDEVLLWTLQDPATPPPDAGRSPWRRGAETHLGLLRPDGSQKPVAADLAAGIAPDDVARPGPLDRLTKPFWLLVVVGTVAVAGAGLLARRGRVST